jgi:hypothetical protein
VEIYDIEQNDPVRIKVERDLLVEAIVKMGIDLGHISPDAVLTGAHLLMICEDVVRINNEVAKYKPDLDAEYFAHRLTIHRSFGLSAKASAVKAFKETVDKLIENKSGD